jgi:hypothetical protein
MLAVLQFIFQSPFTFFGVFILLIVLLDGIANIAKAIFGKRRPAPAGDSQEDR